MINFLDIGFKFILIAFFEFLLHKFQLIYASAGKRGQTVKNSVAAGGFWLKFYLFGEEGLQSYQVIVFDAEFYWGLTVVILLVAI